MSRSPEAQPLSHEHPFAQYVRILGKGPHLSRPLTLDETRAAARMVIDGAVDPVQLGAFLCLLRVKTETPDEVAGFVLAARDAIARPAELPHVDLDWSSYAGKSRQLPWFVLSALLLARNGVRVGMHGTEKHTAGRVYTRETIEALGLPVATSMAEAGRHLAAANFCYLPLEYLSPRLHEIMGLRSLLGLRSPIHTIARMLNPFGAPASLMSVFHPNYRDVHQEAARMMGQPRMAVFKGEGGEVERRPEKPCVVRTLDGEEEWPALLPDSAQAHEGSMDLGRLMAVWRGEADEPYAVATITGTAAVALKLIGRANTIADAEALARALWDGRRREGLAG
ncbi:MAG: glycosyl transferase family protein [Alphaproteobacteria bacterium]|nr:glycosyl transferase family protein [Alphaproteobacteria bacterium]MBF0391424.1 glycosyl transferase family protein [Alphaproteobacteria bacterium]